MNQVITILFRVFTKPGKVKWVNIELLASVLGALRKHHLDFVISTIDSIIESITFGLEINDFKFNQKRVAEVRYLGELYCEKVVDSRLIFDMLFKITCYGHEGGIPRADVINSLDLPDDFFRIRLVCTLLDVLGDLVEVFDRGPAKKKLDFFMTFFQYYVTTKEPLPMDTDFLVQDTFAKLRPQWKLLTDFEDAGKAFAELTKQNFGNATGPAVEEEEDSASDDENDDTNLRSKEEVDKSSGQEGEDVTNGIESGDGATEDEDEEEEEHIIVTRPEDEFDPEVEADFDRELAKLMAESVESRKFQPKTMFDVALPMRRRVDNSVAPTLENNSDSHSSNNEQAPVVAPRVLPSTMKFSLLSKKGNRQTTRYIDLPADSTFAVAMKSQQQTEAEEKQRIKNLVLNYDLASKDVENEGEGEYDLISLHPLEQNSNRTRSANQNRGSDTSGLYDGSNGGRLNHHQQKNRHGTTIQPQPSTSAKEGSNRITLAKHLHTLRAVGRTSGRSVSSNTNAQAHANTSKPDDGGKTYATVATSKMIHNTPEIDNKNTFAYEDVRLEADIEATKQPQNPYSAPRVDKAGTSARMQRGRRLQMSDMDWYES